MLHFLIYDVLGTPAILVGLFSLIGLLLQKKGISDVISGTLKTIMGFVILDRRRRYYSLYVNHL
ncbi:integral membrane protein [Klebsiella pneumoniae]|nr:integral membrane protein [Klebsiella pneumoniae]